MRVWRITILALFVVALAMFATPDVSAAGECCVDTSDCGSGETCYADVCKPNCNQDSDCAANVCQFNVCVAVSNPSCPPSPPPPPPQQDCEYDIGWSGGSACSDYQSSGSNNEPYGVCNENHVVNCETFRNSIDFSAGDTTATLPKYHEWYRYSYPGTTTCAEDTGERYAHTAYECWGDNNYGLGDLFVF